LISVSFSPNGGLAVKPLRVWCTALALLVLAACEKEVPREPQVSVDHDTIPFDTVYVGAAPQSSLAIQNDGLEDLVLSSVTLSGDSAFTMDGPLTTTLAYKKRTYVRVIFAPTEAKAYTGTITIASNAANSPSLQVAITGKGVTPP
jgi:hypothetical protein